MGEPSIDALLQQLGDAAVVQRDAATQALIRADRLARAPLRRLLGADISSSLRARAAFTLAGLRPSEQAELLAEGGPQMQGRLWGAVPQIATAVAAQTGIRIHSGSVGAGRQVAVEAQGLGTLATLDTLSLAVAGSWEPTADGAVRLSSNPGARYPTSYVGPFRVRVTTVATLRTTDYRTTRAEVTLGIDVTALTLLSPIGTPLVNDLEAVDDSGARHKLTVTPGWATEPAAATVPPDLPPLERCTDILMRRLIGPPDSFIAKTELPLHALAIKSLRGGFTYLFSGSYVDVQLEQLAPGLQVELDEGIVLRVDALTDYECTLSIKTADWPHGDSTTLAAQPLSTVALGIDQNQHEALATISRLTSVGTGHADRRDRRMAVQLSFDPHELRPVRSLRLRLISDIRSVPVRFVFNNIALP